MTSASSDDETAASTAHPVSDPVPESVPDQPLEHEQPMSSATTARKWVPPTSLTFEVPLVFLPDASQTPQRAGVDDGRLLPLLDALGRIDPYGHARDRAQQLSTVIVQAANAAANLNHDAFHETFRAQHQARRTDASSTPPAQSPPTVAQSYFRLRTAAMPASQSLGQCLAVTEACATDMLDAPLSGSDIARIATGLVQIFRSYTGTATGARTDCAERTAEEKILETRPQPPTIPRPGDVGQPIEMEDVWWRRWIIGHQLHALFNVYASWALADTMVHLQRDETTAGVRHIHAAAALVEAFAPARALALAVPPDFYQDVLRPTMLPPLCPVPLTGRMHVEYRAWQQRLGEFLHVVPQSNATLAAEHPMLMLARERLVEADLIESERHVTSVEPLVGDSRSLIQGSKSTENALSALRRIRHERAHRAQRYLRYPDAAHRHPSEDQTGQAGIDPDAAR